METVNEICVGIVQGAKPQALRPTEVVWSRKSEESERAASDWILRPAARERLTEAVDRDSGIPQATVVLARADSTETQSPTIAGCAVAVRTGSRRGLLTARHVVCDESGRPRRLPLQARFTAPASRLRKQSRPVSTELYNVGFTVGVVPEQLEIPVTRRPNQVVQPGLPDVALIILNEEALTRQLTRIATEEGETFAHEPAWVDLEAAAKAAVAIPETRQGVWFLAGSLKTLSRQGWRGTGL